jgi:hypothetical protein
MRQQRHIRALAARRRAASPCAQPAIRDGQQPAKMSTRQKTAVPINEREPHSLIRKEDRRLF